MHIFQKMGAATALSLLLAPAGFAQNINAGTGGGALPGAGSTEITFGGTGQSDKDFDNGDFAFSGSYGWYLTDQWMVSIRQSFSGLGDGDNWTGSSLAAVDYHFSNGTVRPFVGVNAGLRYGGDFVGDSFGAGAQAGVKYYVQDAAFIFGRAEYGYTFDEVDQAEDAWDQGTFGYGFGVGMNF